jgi:GxxExxY protein
MFNDVFSDYAFFERMYKNALYYELKENVFKIETPKRIKVNYKEIEVVDYSAPIVVDGKEVLELTAAK